MASQQDQVQIANEAGIALALEDGTDLADKVNPRLISLQLTESREEKADRLELTIHNTDGRLAPPSTGAVLTLKLGWLRGGEVTAGLVNKGRFKVDEVEESGSPDLVTVRARSADFTGTYRKRRDKGHRDTTLGAVVRRVAQANGYTARVHASLAGKPIAFAEQAGKSDMQFVFDLGRRYDAVATVKDRTVLFMPAGGGTSAGGAALPALTILRRDAPQWRFTEARRGDYDGAEAQWHDKAAARKRTTRAGGSENPKRIKRTYATEAEAKQAAEAEHARARRGRYTFETTLALGDAAIEPERPVTLSGYNSRVDGIRWVVKEVVHSLGGDSGLVTRVSLESRT